MSENPMKAATNFGPESRPKQPMPPFEIGLNEVAGKQEQQDDKTDQIEIDQQEHEGIAGRREKGIRVLAAWSQEVGVVKGQRQTGE